MKHCPECGAAIPPREKGKMGRVAKFCSDEHKERFQKRQAKEGRAIVALAKAWRASRNRKEDREVGAKALSELCATLDQFNAQDRAAGRPGPIAYAEDLLNDGTRYMDRMRRT